MTGLSDRLQASWPTPRRLGAVGVSLLTLLLVVTINAVYGGVGLMVNGLGMPAEWLNDTILRSWDLGGAALLLTVALPQLAAAWLVARRHPLAASIAVLVGIALVLWIAVQLLVLRRYFILQPVIAGVGIAEVLLARLWSGRSTRRPSRRSHATALPGRRP
jgi:hypothetical protein